MAKLIAPDGSTKMVKYGEFWCHEKWHFLGSNSKGERYQQKSICGVVCFDPEYALLDDVDCDDICRVCWPFSSFEDRN